MVRAKFKVMAMNVVNDELISINFTASKDEAFGKYTPCGSIQMSVVKEVAKQFEVGEEYHADFTKVKEEKA